MWAHKINDLMHKHGFMPIGIGESDWGRRLFDFIEWLSNQVGDVEKDNDKPKVDGPDT